jgi:hypothetical protein
MIKNTIQKLAIAFTALTFASSLFAGGGIALLGEDATDAISNQSQLSSGNGSFYPTKRSISTISGPNGVREANFDLYTKDGQSYVQPEAFGQVFQGSTMTQQNGQFLVQRPDGGSLTFLVILEKMIIVFLGMEVETGVCFHQQNGQTYVPLNDMGQFYGQQFSQTGSQLVSQPTNQQSTWLQESWNNTLSNNGALDYENQITQASQNYSSNIQQQSNTTNNQQVTSGNTQVFKDITATVFSSSESKQGGAYGEWLRKDDLYVALPKRFEGNRPWVAVQGPKGTYEAEIKDVGPWNINDPYWVTGNRPQAESGHDLGQTRSGVRKTNLAGIDLSYRLGTLCGIGGKGKVNWWFVQK